MFHLKLNNLCGNVVVTVSLLASYYNKEVSRFHVYVYFVKLI